MQNYDPVADVDVPVKVNQETTQGVRSRGEQHGGHRQPGGGLHGCVNTLREAIAFANAKSAETIGATSRSRSVRRSGFNTARTITLTQENCWSPGRFEIQGPGADLLTISGNNASRFFARRGGNSGVRIADLTITGGSAGAAGAVRNENTGVMMLIGVAMTGKRQHCGVQCRAVRGHLQQLTHGEQRGQWRCGFHSDGLMDIVNTTISGNTASANAGACGISTPPTTDDAADDHQQFDHLQPVTNSGVVGAESESSTARWAEPQAIRCSSIRSSRGTSRGRSEMTRPSTTPRRMASPARR